MTGERTRRYLIRRIIGAVLCVIALALLSYVLWRPGLDVRDGRHDRGSNAVWLAHGWLGADEWFVTYKKTNEFAKYRSLASIKALAENLQKHHITDVFPHLCPAEPTGGLPAVDAKQLKQFLDIFSEFRVLPWIGGPNGSSVRPNDRRWRSAFITNICTLIAQHPRLAGVHLNVEPLPSGDKDFLLLLKELRAALPPGKCSPLPPIPRQPAGIRSLTCIGRNITSGKSHIIATTLPS